MPYASPTHHPIAKRHRAFTVAIWVFVVVEAIAIGYVLATY